MKRFFCLFVFFVFFSLGSHANGASNECDVVPCKWERLGINGGGLFPLIIVSPHDSNTLYVLSDKGGIHRSNDGGITWKMCNKGFKRGTFYGSADLIIDPDNPNRLFAATGCAGWARNHWCPGGIFRSLDGGETWKQLILLPFGAEGDPGKGWGNRLAFHRDSTDIIYAATYHKGLFCSTNGGESWSLLGLADRFLTGILTDPDDSECLLATAWSLSFDANRKGGILESHDGGKTWNTLLDCSNVVSLQRAVFNPNWLAAAVGTDGVRISLDRGKTWRAPVIPAACRHIRLAKFQPGHESRLYIVSGGEGSGMYYSDDFGETWTKAVSDFEKQLIYPEDWYHYDRRYAPFVSQSGINSLVFDERIPGRIYIGDNFTTWRSDDDGKTYVCHPHGLDSMCLYQVVPDPVDDNVIYANTADIGLLKSINDGATFRWPFHARRPDDNGDDIEPATKDELRVGRTTVSGIGDKLINETATLLISPENNQKLAVNVTIEWMKPRHAGVYISQDGGKNWGSRCDGIPQGTYLSGMIALSPDLEPLLVAVGQAGKGVDDVYYSPKNGEPFRRFAPGLPNEDRPIFGSPFGCLPNLASNAQWVFAATLKGLYRCPIDASTPWQKVGEDLPAGELRSLAAAKEKGIVWVGSGSGVFVSHDNGETFKKVSLPGMTECRGIAIDDKNASRVFAAIATPWWAPGESQPGIYFTDDEGTTWKKLSDMPGEGVSWHISIDPKDSHVIYVGTNGLGAWRTNVQ